MLTLRLLLALALATASGASAQQAPVVRGLTPAGGITVTGRGTASVAPDRARVTIQLFAGVGVAGTGTIPVEDASNALRDALRANGVFDAREVLPSGSISLRGASPAIVGTVAKPTRDRLEAIAHGVANAIPAKFAPMFSNGQLQIALISDDCSPDEARAERAAFADARERAQRLATIAGLHLGAVIAIAEPQSFQAAGCPSKPDAVEANGNAGQPFTNAYGPLVLPIVINETVTFAIAGS
ncbi:MAG: SIMPL domain-containing protein [Candidatus Eremiobacteraeota bacterium]|nr:SIMPL domain-containing protein [Candidatus Eremiobacteraeota bacterium]